MNSDVNSMDKRDREALHWVQVLNRETVSDADMEAYLSWMEADPENAAVFRRLDAAWIAAADAKDAIRAQFGPEARDAKPESLLCRLGEFFRPRMTPQFAGVAVLAVLIVLAVLPQLPQEQMVRQYASAVGETRAETLDDGSVVTLNTNTVLSVAYGDGERRVMLEQGGALFDVASNPERPFTVATDGGAVTVLGTVFDVLRTPHGFDVTVLEGRVTVSAGDENGAVMLTPDQRAVVDTGSNEIVTAAIDADAATAWRRGQLVYRDARLGDVLQDLNRYSASPLTLGDASLADRPFTGVLTIADPRLMMDRLGGLTGLTPVPAADGGLRLDSMTEE